MPTSAERNSKFSPFCCPSSIRWLVLLLSFSVLSSLFANLQLFNLAILYTQGEAKQRLLMPQEFFGIANALDSGASRLTINWADEQIWSDMPANNSKATTMSTRKLSQNEERNKLVNEGKIMMNSKDYQDYNYREGGIQLDGQNGMKNATMAKSTTGKTSTTLPFGGVKVKKLRKITEKKEKTTSKRDANLERKFEEEEAIDEMQQHEEEFEPAEQQKMQSELMGHKIRRLSQSLLFSVPGMAILVAHFPCYLLVRRFGAHKPIFAALLISGIISGAFPFLMDFETPFAFILFARIFLGFCISPAFSFLGQMSQRWATVGEQHFFVLIGFMAIQFGPSISWFLAIGLLRFDHFSHIQVFGIHSVISILLALIWLIFYRDQPQKHQMVNGEELNYIVKKKPRPGRPLRLPTTLFCLLLRSTSAWACWISSFCYFFALFSLLIFYPIFSHKVLGQTLDHSLVTPFILMFLAHFLFHAFAASSSSQPATWKMRLFNSGAFLLSAMFFLGIAVIPGNNELSAVSRRLWLLWFCLLPLGATSIGFIKSSAIVGGGPFTQYIVSHMQCAFGLAYALVPTLLFSSITEGSIIHWRLLFLGCALLLLLGMAIFVILGRGIPTSLAEQWADDARGDAPLLLIKFSPIHQSAAAPTTSQQ